MGAPVLQLILVVLAQTQALTPQSDGNAVTGVTLAADIPIARAGGFLPRDVELQWAGIAARVAAVPLAVPLGGAAGTLVGGVLVLLTLSYSMPLPLLAVAGVVGGALGLLAACVIGSRTVKEDLIVALPIVLGVVLTGVGLVGAVVLGLLPFIPAVAITSGLALATPVVTAFSKRWAAREEYGVELATF